MHNKSVTLVLADNESKDCMQHLNYWVTHELTRLEGQERTRKPKKSVLLNKNLILREDLMAKKMLATSEFSPLNLRCKLCIGKLFPVVLEETCWIATCTARQQGKAFFLWAIFFSFVLNKK